MNSIPVLSGLLGLAFASGVNLYAAVLVTGLGIRLGWLTGLPGDLSILANPVILTVAGILYFLEFFADKIPYVSVAWDAIHTIIRPLGGAALALASTANLSPEAQTLAMLAGGSIALGTHATKMGYRLIAHASPEPVSDSVFSLAEDVGVVGLVLLAYKHPIAGICVVGALLIGIAFLLPLIVRILRFVLNGVTARIAAWFTSPEIQTAAPDWLEPQLSGSAQVYRCFARSIGRSPRLHPGYLVVMGDRQFFAFRRWTRVRLAPIEGSELGVRRGLLFDVVSGPRWSVYFTKDCVAPQSAQPMRV